MNKLILNYLKDNNYKIGSKSTGITLKLDKNELLIKGCKLDLIELADYILDIALSKQEKDHLHLDTLSLLNEDSDIKELIIEKNIF